MATEAPVPLPLLNRPPRLLAEAEWRARRAAHEASLAPWLEPHRERAARGLRHPVYDFLFEYYHLRPSQLRRYHPGWGWALGGDAAREEYASLPAYALLETANGSHCPHGIGAAPQHLKPERWAGVAWILAILEASEARPPFFGCYGLHEWAMVYRTPEVRHAAIPLRFSEEELARIVESQALCCTHYDAFRFFTPAARPLNKHQPRKETMPQLEQRGCLHANMDLYKWAYKLLPFTSSELVAEAFALAVAIREVDMRASPYDLQHLGFAPIRIETAEGRAEYERYQRHFAAQGAPIRTRLLAVARQLADALPQPPSLPSSL